MRTPWIHWSLAIAAFGFAGCGRDEVTVVDRSVPADAIHGGQVVMLGDTRVEVVHEPATGTINLYPLRTGDRVVVFEDAPVLEIRTSDGVVPVTFNRLEGRANIWTARHVAFETSSISDVRLVASVSGRRFDEPVRLTRTEITEPATEVTPASLPPESASPSESAAPGATPIPPEQEPAAADSTAKPAKMERTLSLEGGGNVALVRDGDAVTATITDADGNALAAERVVLVAGSDEFVFAKQDDGTYLATLSASLPSDGLRFVVTIDGKDRSASLPGSWSASSTSSTSLSSEPVSAPEPKPADAPLPPVEAEPADAPAPAEAPAPKEEPAAPARVERTLSLEGGGNARLVRDGSNLTLTLVDADEKAIEAEKVVLVLDGREVAFARAEGSWTATVESSAAADARLLVTVDGRERAARFPASWTSGASLDAPVAVEETVKEPTASATRLLALDSGAKATLSHDAKTGTVTVSVRDADGKALAVDAAVLVLDGDRKVVLSSDDESKSWTGSSEDLRAATIAGRLVLTIDGREASASLNASAATERREVETGKPSEAPAPRDEGRAPPAAGDDIKRQQRPEVEALADEEPVNPPDPHPENSPKPGPANPPSTETSTQENEARVALEGSFLLAMKTKDGGDAQLEVLHDKNVGKLTIQPIVGQRAFLLEEAPILFLPTKDGPRKSSLNRVEGKPVWWVIHTDLKDRELAGAKLRLKIGGTEVDVDLAGPHVATATASPSFVVFDGTRYTVDHDRVAGAVAVAFGTTAALQNLTFQARVGDRMVPVTFTAVPGRPGTFRATHESFRAERLQGQFTARMNGREVTGAVQTDATPATAGSGSTSGSPAAGGSTSGGSTSGGSTSGGSTSGGSTSGGSTGGGSTSGTGTGTGGGTR